MVPGMAAILVNARSVGRWLQALATVLWWSIQHEAQGFCQVNRDGEDGLARITMRSGWLDLDCNNGPPLGPPICLP
ncbi:hypothetical protein AMTR_s00027p00174250 [Amborella trichopoda]|uniref:Uncharacterized protein n=1 Tax=Amborella trichopoda TaxID=13333 RepID=W1PTZ0_AMBTC|nr:hypothetical protein AMTR_s00027p00174250 [Amborella trichopoda]